MSLFEIIGESLDPGPIGGIDTGPPPREPRSRTAVLLRGVVALAIVTTVFLGTAVVGPLASGRPGMAGGVIGVYLLLGYFVRPRPDYENMGWLGGILDNPFRYSDDINQMLWVLRLVLWPGRWASTAIVDLFRRPLASAA
jgi:hypothetical protein